MALHPCPDCGGQISDLAPACPHCGRPVDSKSGSETKAIPEPDGLTTCPKCAKRIQPVVTNVGGGSCSLGSREKWTCPSCRKTIHRSGCFIATAAYESENAVEVQFLREFRDRVMLRAPLGSLAVQAYYRTSPKLAALMNRSAGARCGARRLLDIVIRAIEKATPLSRADVRRRTKPPRA